MVHWNAVAAVHGMPNEPWLNHSVEAALVMAQHWHSIYAMEEALLFCLRALLRPRLEPLVKAAAEKISDPKAPTRLSLSGARRTASYRLEETVDLPECVQSGNKHCLHREGVEGPQSVLVRPLRGRKEGKEEGRNDARRKAGRQEGRPARGKLETPLGAVPRFQ